MAAFSDTSFSTSAFSTSAFSFGDVPPPTPPSQPAGGGGRAKRDLPQYYSRQIYGSGKIALPQEKTSHEIAVEVLDDAKELQSRIEDDDTAFNEMLEIVEHLLAQIAAYVESQQIYNIIVDLELRIRAKQDALRIEEEDEFGELIVIL